MPISAIITGDVVASTQIGKTIMKKLLKEFDAILSEYTFEFYRGDSFQVYAKESNEALALVLRLRLTAMKINPVATMPVSDVRCAIGIGWLKGPVRAMRTAADEAFVLSGRAFDAMRPPQRLSIVAPEAFAAAAIGLQGVADFADYILQRMTVKQAAVVSELLLNQTQSETAKRLKKSQATVNKHARAAGWPQLENLLLQYHKLTETFTI